MNKKSSKDNFIKFYKKHWFFGFIGNGSLLALPMIPAVVYYQLNGWPSFLEMLIIFLPAWFFPFAIQSDKSKLIILSTIIYWIWGLVFAFLAFTYVTEGWFFYIFFSIFAIYTAIYYVLDAL